ncbi:heavy metal-binding protein HIP-like isoform X4 [Mytilus galloprovincialis]
MCFTLNRIMKVALAFALLSFAYATPEQSVLEYFPVFNAAKADIDELKQLMTDLKAEVADLRAENQRFRDELNSNYTATRVAFYAYMSVDRGIDWFSLDKKIIYDKVNLNIGDGYDVLTGVFTAPSSGTYIFNTVSVAYNKSYMTLLLKINGNTADIAFPDAFDHDDRSTATTVTIVMLLKGDQVYAVNGDKKGGRMMESGDHDARCSFSGYRLY